MLSAESSFCFDAADETELDICFLELVARNARAVRSTRSTLVHALNQWTPGDLASPLPPSQPVSAARLKGENSESIDFISK